MKRFFSIILFGLVAVSMMATDYSYNDVAITSVTSISTDKKSGATYYYYNMILSLRRQDNTVEDCALYLSRADTNKDRLEGTYTTKYIANDLTLRNANNTTKIGDKPVDTSGSKTSTITIVKMDVGKYCISGGTIYVKDASNTYTYTLLASPVFDCDQFTCEAWNYSIHDITGVSLTSKTLTFQCEGDRRGTSDTYSYNVAIVFPSADIEGEYSNINADPSLRIANDGSSVTWQNGSASTTRNLKDYLYSNLQIVKDANGTLTICGGKLQTIGGNSDKTSPRIYHFADSVKIDEGRDNGVLLTSCKNLVNPIANVQLLRSLSKDYYNTFCSPISLTADQINVAFGEGTDIRELVSTSYDGEQNVITLNFSTSSLPEIEKGVPYLIKPGNNVVNPVFTNVAISDIATEAQKVEKEAVSFYGILSPYTLEADDDKFLFLAANNTLKFGQRGTLKGMRAYFYIKDNVPAQKLSSARARIQMGQDVTTSVLNTTDCSNAKKVLRNGQIVILRDGKTYSVMGTVCEL